MKPFIINHGLFLVAALMAALPLWAQEASPAPLPASATNPLELFAPDNLHAWCAVPFDAKGRLPTERALMLKNLGFKRFVYDWRDKDIPAFDAEFEAMKNHGIEITGWWSPTDPNDPVLRTILEVFKRQKVHPQLWVMGSGSLTTTPAAQQQRVEEEAERIRKIVEIAKPYGVPVHLYNHNGWFGIPDNEVAVIGRLNQLGVTGVGMVYNFSHGHNDIADFPAVWKRIKPYVITVNVTGMVPDGESKIMPPSQGIHEQAMLRVILESGWIGPIGLIAEQGGDAEVTLGNYLRGLEWLKKEFVRPGSGGPKPDFTKENKAAKKAPLNPSANPLHTRPVNVNRIYNFYAKQAQDWRETPRPLLPEYPGLDSGLKGHWGNQNEETWRDGRWNNMDCGPCMGGVFRNGNTTIAKAVCVRFGENGERAGCYDPVADEWRLLWQGGFVKFTDVRHGLMDGLQIKGTVLEDPLTKPLPRNRAAETYRGYYRHGKRTIFAFDQAGQELLRSVDFINGKVQRLEGGLLHEFTKGGPAQWPQVLETKGLQGQPIAGWPFTIDTLTLPSDNPWKTLFFAGGHDFFSNGDIALCTMTGDVWRVSGVNATLSKLRWKRMAAGLHQPLGLVVVDGKVCVLGRDQITRLHDLNGNGEADFYECLTNDFDTPTGGHDFMCGLERDATGNFYTVSGRAGLLKISPGKKTEVIASGFRNPDGFGLSPDGIFTVPYSEGEWTPTSAIALIKPGGYYGYPGPKKDLKTEPPLLWLPRGVDNSAGGQTWVPDKTWGPLAGKMVHLSYGTGNAFLVLRQLVNGVWQGAAVPLPGDFNAGAHRGRFSPHDGQLYVSGMTGWGTYTPDDGCLQRLRYTGGPMHLPVAFEARDNGLLLTFSEKLDPSAAKAAAHFSQCWNYRYSAAYGSPELSLRHPDKAGHDVLEITSAHVVGDGTQLFLEIPQLQPAGQIHAVVQPQPGVERELFLTAHSLGLPFTDFPGYQTIAKSIWVKATETPTAGTRANPFTKGNPGRALRLEAAASLQFATKELEARAGERLSVTFANPDVLPHNWVLLSPGSAGKVGGLSNQLVSDAQGFAQHYVPDVPEVLAYTDMVNPGKEFSIHFDAPSKPGDYPYLCTFPGHWMVMKGVLRVE